jgi:hypothetical protein
LNATTFNETYWYFKTQSESYLGPGRKSNPS